MRVCHDCHASLVLNKGKLNGIHGSINIYTYVSVCICVCACMLKNMQVAVCHMLVSDERMTC